MPKTKPTKPLDPKTQLVVDEIAKRLAERLLEEGVEFEELSRIDERVLPLVRRIGNKAIEELAKQKVDSAVKQNEEFGLKVHRSKRIEFEFIFGSVGIESPYMWRELPVSVREIDRAHFVSRLLLVGGEANDERRKDGRCGAA